MIDLFLNPSKNFEKKQLEQFMKNLTETNFPSAKLGHSFPSLFQLMWHSSLPCFSKPSTSPGFLLKKCFFAGEERDCKEIFKPLPTSSGICCAFNHHMVLQESEYSKLVTKMQEEATGYKMSDKQDHRALVGLHKGLKVIVDQHSNLVTPGSVFTNSKAFQVFIGSPYDSTGIHSHHQILPPGSEHFLHLSPTSVTANPKLTTINPEKRKCLFTHENTLKFHKSYSFQSCIFECHLYQALLHTKCIPWYLPQVDNTTCDPWQATQFIKRMETVKVEDCPHCLADCESVKYSITTTSAHLQ